MLYGVTLSRSETISEYSMIYESAVNKPLEINPNSFKDKSYIRNIGDMERSKIEKHYDTRLL